MILEELQIILSDPLVQKIIYGVIILLIAIVADRILLNWFKRIALRLGVSYDVVKGLHVFFRFIIFIIALFAIASLGVIPSEYFVGAGALIGTAIGFSLTRSTSNFISGAYVLASGLFRINDYIRIGSDEGIVVDMTINYTKIRRPDGTFLIISNNEVLNKTVVSYKITHGDEEYYLYPLYFTVGNDVPYEKVREVYEKIVESVKSEVEEIGFQVNKVTRLETEYVVLLKIRDAEKIPNLKNKVLGIITEELR